MMSHESTVELTTVSKFDKGKWWPVQFSYS